MKVNRLLPHFYPHAVPLDGPPLAPWECELLTFPDPQTEVLLTSPDPDAARALEDAYADGWVAAR